MDAITGLPIAQARTRTCMYIVSSSGVHWSPLMPRVLSARRFSPLASSWSAFMWPLLYTRGLLMQYVVENCINGAHSGGDQVRSEVGTPHNCECAQTPLGRAGTMHPLAALT